MPSPDSPIRVYATLYCGPTFWTRAYWAESARQFDHIGPSTPLDERPVAVFDVGLDAKLGNVLEAACDEWGIVLGLDAQNHGASRREELHRQGFVIAGKDAAGINEKVGYSWPHTLSLPTPDGEIDLVPAIDATFRQLIAAQALGLLDGEATRPYVFPVRPQGAGQIAAELAHLAPNLIRSALAAVHGAGGDAIVALREGEQLMGHADHFVSTHPIEASTAAWSFKSLSKKLRERRRGPDTHS